MADRRFVTVAEKIGRGGVVRERVHDLLGGPVGGGVLGHVEVDDAPAEVGEDARPVVAQNSSRICPLVSRVA
jgi:hypothetical protein